MSHLQNKEIFFYLYSDFFPMQDLKSIIIKISSFWDETKALKTKESINNDQKDLKK